MTWIFVAVALGLAGLVVIAVLSVRVFTAARALGRELDRARARITSKQDILRQNMGAFRNPE